MSDFWFLRSKYFNYNKLIRLEIQFNSIKLIRKPILKINKFYYLKKNWIGWAASVIDALHC